jgi:WD40 repeat protein
MAVVRAGQALLIGLSILSGAALAEPPEDKPSPQTDLYGDPLPEGAIARYGTIRWRHVAGVFVGYGREGKTLVSVGPSDVRIWDRDTGRVTRLINTGKGRNEVAALSNDQKLLAIVKDFRTIKIFDVETGKETCSLGRDEDTVVSIAISPDSQYLAARCHGESTPLLWRLKTKEKLKKYEEPKDDDLADFLGGIVIQSRSLAFSPDGKYLASASERGAVALWNTASGKLVRQVKSRPGGPPAVAFSPDGKLLAWEETGGGTVIADLPTGKEQHTLPSPAGAAQYLAFTPDSKHLVTILGYDIVQFWDVATGRLLHKIQGDLSAVHSFTFSPDGKTLASALDCRVRQWSAATGEERRYSEPGFGPMNAVALSPDGKTAATASIGGPVVLWEAGTGKPAGRFFDHYENPVFSPDSKMLALCSDSSGEVALCEMVTGKQQLLEVSDDSTVRALRFGPHARTLVTCDDRMVRILKTISGKEEHRFDIPLEHRNNPSVMLASDSRSLAAYTSDAIQGREVFGEQLFPPCSLENGQITNGALSRDGRMAALVLSQIRLKVKGHFTLDSTKSPDIIFVELATGRERKRFKATGLSAQPLCLSPCGGLLAHGDDNDIRIYELRTGKEVRRLQGHEGSVTGLAFSADASRLVSASDDTTALVWDLSSLSSKRPGPAQKLDRDRLRALWSDLADSDAAKAYRAIGTLAPSPESIPFLERELLAVSRSFPERKKQIERLIALLDSERYEKREQASRELKSLREDAEILLRAELAGEPSAEVRRRITLVLQGMDGKPPSGETLRVLRAIEALEQAGTAEARRALHELTHGPMECRLTREAKAALDRLEKRPGK